MSTRSSASGQAPVLIPHYCLNDRRPRPLDRDVATIGRARGCDLCLEASDVSTIHCVLFRAADGYHVRDCNSRTGTRLNGNAVRGGPRLRNGDVLQVGPFSFEVQVPPCQPAADPVQLQRWLESRRRLAEHALRLRRLLRDRTDGSSSTREGELRQEAARFNEKMRVYDRRLADLNEAERELEAEREQLHARIQTVEAELAHRLDDTECQVRERWHEFQRRCKAEEAQLLAQAQEQVLALRDAGGVPVNASSDGAAEALAEREQHVAQQLQTLCRERQEFDAMKQQLQNGQAATAATLDERQLALAQQEATLRGQRGELARMLSELRQLQEELRKPHQTELDALTRENDDLRQMLAAAEAQFAQAGSSAASERALKESRAKNELMRMLLQERDRALTEARQQLAAAPSAEAAAPADLELLRTENDSLQQLLAEKDRLLEEARAQAAAKPDKAASELERYEAELNQDRQQLERDRAKLHTEIEQLRSRNQELDEATRELEMEMSRERAELARERMRMERMREELKADMEKLQREMSVRESLGPVQRLREEMNLKKAGTGKSADPAADRLRHLRTGNDTPRP
jgi:chromosome segregation ATPase